jgi:UDP-N-acetylmuramoyl-L-alanyl-D-glutamate--2,6-diaminopimelate ligase
MTAGAPTLRDILDGIAVVPPPLAGLVSADFRLDSRAIEPGDVFVALEGQRQHGAAFADQAFANGAACMLYDTPLPGDIVARLAALPSVGIAALRAHLGTIADRAYGAPSRQLATIGVTGTNGKTSTVHLLAQALGNAGVDVATIGTLGSGRPDALAAGERTTPDVLAVHALLRRFVDDGVTHVAMEVSSHALDQGRVDGVSFAIAVFTNLSRDHLDYHGDMRAYGAAKQKLFAWPGLGAAIVNTDDAFGRELIAHIPDGVCVLRCGRGRLDGKVPDFHATDITTDLGGLRFVMATPLGTAVISSPLLGLFNVANLLGVAACLHVLDWPLARIAEALSELESVPGRMNRYGGGHRPLTVVDYAHTPDALEQTLASLREHFNGRRPVAGSRPGRLHCVFGCGGERDAGKRPQMAAIAETLADTVIVTDDNPRGEDGDAIVADILAGFARPSSVVVQRDRARAIRDAIDGAGAGDIVLIAGKGHERYQEISGRRLDFDDAAQVCAALEVWPC